ncbi:MAG: VOC family protein [Gammaproteobacteria bacterium]|nr:VOC family protein [Gammaproteobacteria bacterium]MBU1439776.1 VOC family protein [Gammaproteobacteria bacterium]
MTTRPGLRFSHIGFHVTDIDRQAEFYTSVLDFTETDRGQLPGPDGPLRLVFLSRDPAEHHQLVLVSGRPERVDFNVINQISMKADSLQTLVDFHRRVKQAGVRELAPVTHGNALSVYFHDPEGNRVELYWDLPWYVSQPCRVAAPFELPPEELLAWAEAHARGMPGFRPRAEWQRDMAQRMGLASP